MTATVNPTPLWKVFFMWLLAIKTRERTGLLELPRDRQGILRYARESCFKNKNWPNQQRVKAAHMHQQMLAGESSNAGSSFHLLEVGVAAYFPSTWGLIWDSWVWWEALAFSMCILSTLCCFLWNVHLDMHPLPKHDAHLFEWLCAHSTESNAVHIDSINA